MGCSYEPGPPSAGMFPAIFILRRQRMKELSIFVDESGDFGSYEVHSPFYIFTLVLHDQSKPIHTQIDHLKTHLRDIGLEEDHCFHAGPIIRREADYSKMDIPERRKCLNRIMTFAKNVDFQYATFYVEKKHIPDSVALTVSLSKQLSAFIKDEYAFFNSFDKVIIYYDNGQVELGKMLATVFTVLIPNAEFRKVVPADYRLFQVADLICTMKLICLKEEIHALSKSESSFFGSLRDLHKNYIKPLLIKQYKHKK